MEIWKCRKMAMPAMSTELQNNVLSIKLPLGAKRCLQNKSQNSNKRFVDVNTTNTWGRFTRVRRCCFCRPAAGTRCQSCCKKRQDMSFCTCNIKNCVKHRRWLLIWPAQLKLVGFLPQTFEDPHREWQRRQRESAPCCQTGGNRVLADF